jgi:hypothetical protein
MTNKPKSVAEMTTEEYTEYLRSLDQDQFMKVVAHDVKKVVSVAHGYLSLIRLDVDLDEVSADKLIEYITEMEQMIAKSYMYIDAARSVYEERDS